MNGAARRSTSGSGVFIFPCDKSFCGGWGGAGGKGPLFSKSGPFPPGPVPRHFTFTKLYSLFPRPIFSAWARVSFQRMLGLESRKWSL